MPVLSALAGRRPLGSLPRRIVPIGAALFGSGLFVLVLVATAAKGGNNGGANGLALSAVFGGLLVLSGACCVSSVVVASLAELGRVVHGAARIAVRSVVRSRARSAAVVMALAAVNAGAVAMATAVDSHTHPTGQFVDFMPDNAIVVTTTVSRRRRRNVHALAAGRVSNENAASGTPERALDGSPHRRDPGRAALRPTGGRGA